MGRNWMRNLLENSWKRFKIQPPIFLILNPIFELLKDMFWKNELMKSPLDISQGIPYSISSILTYYWPQTDISIKSYTCFKLKKFSCKKKNILLLWMGNPLRGPCLAISTWRVLQLLSRVQFANSTDTCQTRQLHWQNPFKN